MKYTKPNLNRLAALAAIRDQHGVPKQMDENELSPMVPTQPAYQADE
jgi:hypothetical protein